MKNTFTLIALFFFILNGFSQITTAEYFIDGADPGAGNATSLSITANNTITENFTIPTTGFSNGLHTLHIRVKDNNNTWSLYKRAYFHIQNNNGNATTPQNIVAAEYFIDNNTGTNTTALNITQGLNITENFTIPTTSLSNGLHVLHIHVKDANNIWSLYKRAYFYVHPSNNSVNGTPIVAAEYFFDSDPGVGSANDIAVTQGMTIDEDFTIPVPTVMTDGDHYLYIRVQDQDGNWSLYKRGLFTVDNSLSIDQFNTDSINVYPNPVKDMLHIDFTESANFSYSVYDLNGRNLLKKENLLLKNQVNLSFYTDGIYFIKLTNKVTKQTNILKFIKQ